MKHQKRKPKVNKAKLKVDETFNCWHCKKDFVRKVPAIGKHPYYAYCTRECERLDMLDFHSKAVRLQKKLFDKEKRLHRQATSDANTAKRERERGR